MTFQMPSRARNVPLGARGGGAGGAHRGRSPRAGTEGSTGGASRARTCAKSPGGRGVRAERAARAQFRSTRHWTSQLEVAPQSRSTNCTDSTQRDLLPPGATTADGVVRPVSVIVTEPDLPKTATVAHTLAFVGSVKTRSVVVAAMCRDAGPATVLPPGAMFPALPAAAADPARPRVRKVVPRRVRAFMGRLRWRLMDQTGAPIDGSALPHEEQQHDLSMPSRARMSARCTRR